MCEPQSLNGIVSWEHRDLPNVIPSASSALLFLRYSFYPSFIPSVSSGVAGRSPFRQSSGLNKQKQFIAVALFLRDVREGQEEMAA